MSDLSLFIARQKNLILEEKKKLGLIDSNISHSTVKLDDVSNFSKAVSPNNSSSGKADKEKLINIPKHSTNKAVLDHQENRRMVRCGEYSPLNPNFRVTGKLLLGIGEYEERRRLLEEQRKQQLKEQACLEDHPTKNIQNKSNVNRNKCFASRFVDKSVQVEPSSVDFQQYYNGGQTKLVDEGIQVNEEFHNSSVHRDETPMVKNNKLSKTSLLKTNSRNNDSSCHVQENLCLSLSDCNVSEPLNPSLLSPRERKILEFHGSGGYNPSFCQKRLSVAEEVGGKDTTEAERISQLKKIAYQEELRKQIAEKKKIEIEQEEKRKREEEAIMRRVEEQQRRMKLEFENEHARHRERMEKKHHQPERRKVNFGIGKELTNSESELGSCGSLDYFKRRSDGSERGIDSASNESLSQSVAVKNIDGEAANVSDETGVHAASSSVNRLDRNMNNLSLFKSYPLTACGNEIAQEKGQTLLTANNTLSDRCDDTTLHSLKSVSDTNLGNIYDYRVPKTAGDTPSGASMGNELTESFIPHRKRPVPTPRRKLISASEEGGVASVLSTNHKRTSSFGVENSNLNDSLPIPVFPENSVDVHFNRAAILRCDVQQSKGISEAMLRTEDKWKVPAVQKNIIQSKSSHKSPYHGRILTQLGAFRRQMQIDQMHIEEMMKKKTLGN